MQDAFYKAVESGNLEVVRKFLETNPNLVFSRYIHGETPLHLAGKWGHKNIVELALANSAEVNARTDSGETPLHYAAENGEEGVAAVLLASNAEIDARNRWGQTPLHWAAQNGHVDVLQLLLEHGAQVNATDNLGQTPFRLSARWEPIVAALLRRYGGRDAISAK